VEHGHELLAAGQEIVGNLGGFDIDDEEASSSLLWVCEQVGEALRGSGGDQLPAAIACLLLELKQSDAKLTSAAVAALLRASSALKSYRSVVQAES
jgi:hypothetical protein